MCAVATSPEGGEAERYFLRKKLILKERRRKQGLPWVAGALWAGLTAVVGLALG